MPARTENFVFRISHQERALINQMAEQMSRKPGDAARFVVLTTAKEMINDGKILFEAKEASNAEPSR